MGNYWSTDIQTNPLQIPDGHFDKYGLNEEKSVMIFKPVSSYKVENRYSGIPLYYNYSIKFLIPQTTSCWSHVYEFESNTSCIDIEGCLYFYGKNLGYICVKPSDEKSMASLYEKYGIGKQASSNPVLEQSQNSPSVNL